MRHALLLAIVLLPTAALAEEGGPPTPHLSRFAAGGGPSLQAGVYQLLDEADTPGQSNAVAFDAADRGPRASVSFSCDLRVLEGGDGGSFLFLDTAHYGQRGPAPFLESWVEPNLEGSFAVGIDVHNPPSEEMFTPWGNYQDLPQREVSLHWDGREIVKRTTPVEFRGDFATVEIAWRHVAGGAEVTVVIADGVVFDAYFIAEMFPYQLRPALGAGTRADATTRFDVRAPTLTLGELAPPPRPPLHVEVFHHVLTDNSITAYDRMVDLPHATWAFERVIMTIDLHDAGESWDEWDRNGEVSIWDAEGVKRGIVPFITSYRTPCHWKVDVTHFRPWLSGPTRIEIAAGTTFYKNRGYLMSLSLDYYHGTPELEPYGIVPLWVGTAHYRSAENHFQDFFEPRTVPIDAALQAARVFITTTGHSQVGEFTPSRRTVVFTPRADGDPESIERFENVLWKTDVYLNPNRPQFGTWQFSRAGWAPGDWVRPWWIDLTPHLVHGEEAELRYEPEAYAFEGEAPPEEEIAKARHVVRAYLVLYRSAGQLVQAPTMRITGVEGGSNAAEAGIQVGDYLSDYDGHVVRTVEDLRTAIDGAKETDREKVPVVVFRGSERMELELAPGRMGVNLSR